MSLSWLPYADHVDCFGIDVFRMICEKNLEVIVAKHPEGPYDASIKSIEIGVLRIRGTGKMRRPWINSRLLQFFLPNTRDMREGDFPLLSSESSCSSRSRALVCTGFISRTFEYRGRARQGSCISS